MGTYSQDITAGITTLSAAAGAHSPVVTTTGDTWTITDSTNAALSFNVDNGLAPAAVTVTGGTGADSIGINANLTAAGVKAVINGGDGVDTITVVAQTNATTGAGITVNGGAGADLITLAANANKTTLKYDALDKVTIAANAHVTLDASATTTAVNWTLSGADPSSITYATGSTIAAAAINGVIGTALADTINAGTNAIDTTIDGGAGADTLTGSSTNATTFVYDAADKAVTGAAGGAKLTAASDTAGITLDLQGNTVFTGITSLVGGSGSDNLRGANGLLALDGGAGNDYLWAGQNTGVAATALTGGAGNDEFWYGANEGAKSITYDGVGKSAGDTVHLYNISAYDIAVPLKLASTGADGTIALGGANTLTLTGAAASDAVRHYTSSEGWAFDITFGTTNGNVIGTAGVIDNLVGAVGASYFDGKGGNDNIFLAGASTVVYHAGDTIYSTGAANTLTAIGATAGAQVYMDQIVSTASTALSASWTINGSAYADELRGQANVLAQTLNGGNGDDSIWGGAGAANIDHLIGGAGADTYYYGIDEGADVINAGTTAATGNALDTVNFYNVTSVSNLSGALSAPGGDMVINVVGTAGTSTLTLKDWGSAGTINKLSNVVVGGTSYTLGVDSSNNATFTAR